MTEKGRDEDKHMSTKDNATRVSEITQVIAGLRKHYPTGSTALAIGGASYTVDSLTATLQGFADQRTAVETTRAALASKVQGVRAQAPSSSALLASLDKYLRGTFGSSADTLADFGLAPPKARTPLTAEQKAVAAAKRAATRVARGTKGSVQKKEVKGNVTAKLVVTPAGGSAPAAAPPAPAVTAPVASTPAASPAPAATPAPHTP
jgi:hypothetical protein